MAAICNTAFCKGCAGFASPHSIARAIPSFTTWICPNPKCKVDIFYSCKVCFDEDQGHQIVTTKSAANRHIKNKHNKNTSNRLSKQGKVSNQDEVSIDLRGIYDGCYDHGARLSGYLKLPGWKVVRGIIIDEKNYSNIYIII